VLSGLRSHSEVRPDDAAWAGVFDYYAATIAHLRGAVEEAERRAAAVARALRLSSASARQHYAPRLILIHLRAANLDAARREAANLDAEALRAEPDYRAARALSSLGRLRLAEGDAEGCLELSEIATAVMLEEVIRPNLDIAEALAIRGECELAAGSAQASATLAESHRILVELLGEGSGEARRVGEALARAGILASPGDAAGGP
jgi:hypothetical protein